ncbi:MAG TPA: porin [Nevskiaceae bacterium]|nr:porin [Nevskiaceae bacterium]
METRRPSLRLAPLALASLAFAGPAVAQSAGPSNAELDQRIKILERQLELQKEEADAKAKDATSTKIDEKGVSIRKGDLELKIKGLVQFDARTFIDDYNPTNVVVTPSTNTNALHFNDTGTFRRIRPTLEGTFGPLIGFRLTPEFAGSGSGDAASLVDAYIDLKFDPAYTLRAGKVKGPVALERIQSGGTLTFVERGFPTELAPNRDLGIQLQGELFASTVNYTIGAYNGTADGRDVVTNDGDNKKELGARLFFEPFKNDPGLLQGLGFGVGSSFGKKEQGELNAANANAFLPRYRTQGQNQFFTYSTTPVAATAAAAGTPAGTLGTAGSSGVFADGDHSRIAPQLYYYRGGFGLLSEYIVSEQEVGVGFIPGALAGTTGTALTTPTALTRDKLENTAWQVVASYVLTGEDASFRGVVKPTNPFTIGKPGWGALEVAARYGELEIDEDAFEAPTDGGVTFARYANPVTQASEAKAWAVGVNWYLTGNVKVVVNYIQTTFEGGGGGTADAPEDREDEKAVFGRLQLSF